MGDGMNVGSLTLPVHDPWRDVSFPVWVLYPTEAPAVDTTVGPQGFVMPLAPQAPLAAGCFPLLLLSHGGGSSPFVYRTLAAALAASGYVVALPRHPGDHRDDRSLSDHLHNFVDRPRHLSLAADAVMADERLADGVQPGGFGVIGHSMGGYTALALAGGRGYTRAGERIDGHADPRVRALALFAPAAAFFGHPEGLRAVVVPLLVVMAEHDTLTPPSLAQLICRGVPDASLVHTETVAGAGHHAFLSPFPAALRRPGFLPALDPPGFDREALHRRLWPEVQAFFDRELKSRLPPTA
ncbi:MAG: alpha/beta fold hydrolase [Rhizobacter sp.]|nr:alpha/beta fold hydrolase [Rhizobacter sp.]